MNTKKCICGAEINLSEIEITVKTDWQFWEYAGLFGGKPESGYLEGAKEKTGVYKCACGAVVKMSFQGNSDVFSITSIEAMPV